jgi:hypothetical protein
LASSSQARPLRLKQTVRAYRKSFTIAEGDSKRALDLQKRIDPLAERGEFSNAFHGYGYLLLGDAEKARYWLEKAYEIRDPQLIFAEAVDLGLIASNPATRGILNRPD